MSNIYTNIPPSELTAIARDILTQEEREALEAAESGNIGTLAPWFPLATIDGIEAEWTESLDEAYTPSVPLRAFDTPVPEGSMPGVSRKSAKMLPMGIGYKVGELEMIMQRVSQGGVERDLMEKTVFAHIARGMRGVINRIDLLRSDLLVGAGFTIDENGVKETVAVGRDPLNNPTAGTAWSDTANADPHDDELALVDRLQSFYGLSWDDLVVLTNRVTFNHYRTIDAVAKQLPTVRQITGRLSSGEINDLRGDRELPPVIILNRQIPDTDGANQYLIPTNTWMIVPKPGIEIGKTVWGSPASLMMDDVNVASDDRPGPVALIEESATVPPSRRTVIDALGMPFLQVPNWTGNLITDAGL